MRIYEECLDCAMHTFKVQINNSRLNEEQQSSAINLYAEDLKNMNMAKTPPHLGQDLHKKIRNITDNPDPYLDLKRFYNEYLLDKYEELKILVNREEDPLKAALKLTLLGNIIDFSLPVKIEIEELFDKLAHKDLAIERSAELFEEIQKADTILYLADNCGEIVLDKLFIEKLKLQNPDKKIFFVVRSAPVINDATFEDAIYISVDDYTQVLENGSDAPGTILEECTQELNDLYNSADLIISKGQGNYESLDESDKNIFFLLMAKCNVVARSFDVEKGSLIVARGSDVKHR